MHPRDAAQMWEDNAETWTRHARAGYDRYRDVLNTPAFLGMLPPVAGLRGLDIGCGEAGNTAHLVRAGARMTALDFSPTFLRHARAAHPYIRFVRADAGAMPFADGAFHFATAFMSLMDMPHHEQVVAEAWRVLRPGGRLMVLEFSHLPNPMMQRFYDLYSFNVIPRMGQMIAGDRASYQYLVESIRRFPDQETFLAMIRSAGFGNARYRNLTMGVACLHSGWKL